MTSKTQKIGIAGVGALGGIVAEALTQGIDGYTLAGYTDLEERDINAPKMTFDDLAQECDIIVECLPPNQVSALAKPVLENAKTLILISSSALILHPEIESFWKQSSGKIVIPSGAISGLDAVAALKEGGIDDVLIKTTKPPKGLAGAPFVTVNQIDLSDLIAPKRLFSGSARDAAKAFPANVNVAATLSYAGLGPDKTRVEVWADPNAKGNSHEITVRGGSSIVTSRVDNVPDPSNPKSSMLAGYSIVATLKKLNARLSVI